MEDQIERPKRKTGRKGTVNNPVKAEELETLLDPEIADYTIMQATIQDDYLAYQFRCNKGDDTGDLHKIPANKQKLVEDSLKTAFGGLNVHAACMDDVFKHSGIEVKLINLFQTDVLTGLYHVTGFAITGTPESESVVLTAIKYVSMGGRIAFSTPKLVLDKLSSYKFCDELKAVLDECRAEVASFKEGNYIPVKDPEPEVVKQPGLFDQQPGEDEKDEDHDFENAKV